MNNTGSFHKKNLLKIIFLTSKELEKVFIVTASNKLTPNTRHDSIILFNNFLTNDFNMSKKNFNTVYCYNTHYNKRSCAEKNIMQFFFVSSMFSTIYVYSTIFESSFISPKFTHDLYEILQTYKIYMCVV